jgi:signal transduction histidine kinase
MAEPGSHAKLEMFWKLLNQRSVLVVAVLFVVASGIILWHNTKLAQDLVESTALQDAALYSEAIAEFRTLYTSEVVTTAKEQGLTITHDYEDHAGAIPLPATLSMRLGQRIGESRLGAETRLYSNFPFPYEDRLGLRDEFARDAWASLTTNPATPFHRFEELDGRRVLRYATADVMRPACVNCHNTHVDTPKSDWKEGDVRGVLEVVMPMEQMQAEAQSGLRGTLMLMVGMTVVGVGILGVVIGRLRQTTVDLERRVVEVHSREGEILAMNEELTTARDEALGASRAKSQFLANMSHELRTPLNAIIGYSEMLQEEAESVGQDDFQPDLEKIRSAGKNLLGIISDILDISQIDTGRAELKPETFEVAGLLNELENTFRLAAEGNVNSLRLSHAASLGTIHQDRRKVQQCLGHVLSNACKFTENGAIEVDATRENGSGDWIRFAIRDTGIGMSDEQMGELFQPFTQADASSTRKYGGTGLGLAITKSFCELMGGELLVESEVGQGSTITIRLPAEAARGPTE